MKTVSLMIVVVLSTSAFMSCKNSEEQFETKVYEDVSLELNNGQKWHVPAEMKLYIDSTFNAIDKIKKEGRYSLELLHDLERYKNGFVTTCTMDGKGHEVLHFWLIPYMEVLEMLSKADTKQEKENAINELAYAKNIFEQFFE